MGLIARRISSINLIGSIGLIDLIDLIDLIFNCLIDLLV
jgi:hypothetical protein